MDEIVEKMKERDREEKGTGMKIKKQNKTFPSILTCYKDSRPCPSVSQYQLDAPSTVRYTTPSPHPTYPYEINYTSTNVFCRVNVMLCYATLRNVVMLCYIITLCYVIRIDQINLSL